MTGTELNPVTSNDLVLSIEKEIAGPIAVFAQEEDKGADVPEILILSATGGTLFYRWDSKFVRLTPDLPAACIASVWHPHCWQQDGGPRRSFNVRFKGTGFGASSENVESCLLPRECFEPNSESKVHLYQGWENIERLLLCQKDAYRAVALLFSKNPMLREGDCDLFRLVSQG